MRLRGLAVSLLLAAGVVAACGDGYRGADRTSTDAARTAAAPVTNTAAATPSPAPTRFGSGHAATFGPVESPLPGEFGGGEPDYANDPPAEHVAVSPPIPVADALARASSGLFYVFVLELETSLVRVVTTDIPGHRRSPALLAYWTDSETLVLPAVGGWYEIPMDAPVRFVRREPRPPLYRQSSADGLFRARGDAGTARGGHGAATISTADGVDVWRIDDVEGAGWAEVGHWYAFRSGICAGGQLSVLDPLDGVVRELLAGVTDFTWRPGSASLAANAPGIALADANTGAVVTVLASPPGAAPLFPIAFSPDGARLTFVAGLNRANCQGRTIPVAAVHDLRD